MWQSVNGELKEKFQYTIFSGVPPPAPEHLKLKIPDMGIQCPTKYKSYIEYERHLIDLLADDLPKDRAIPIVLNLEGIDEEIYPDYDLTNKTVDIFDPLTNKLINNLNNRTGHITIILDGYGENLIFVQNLPADKLIFTELEGGRIGPFHPRVKAVQVNKQDTGMEHGGFGTEVLFNPNFEYIWIDAYLQGGYYHLDDTLSSDLANGELAPNLKELHLSIKGSMVSLNALLDAIKRHQCLENCEIIWMLTEERNLDKIDLKCANGLNNFILLVQEFDGEWESCPPGYWCSDYYDSDSEAEVESDGYGDLIYIKESTLRK